MNCQNCGAAMQPVGNRNYFRCPYCETFAFPEETGDGIAIVGGETKFDCPICTNLLTPAAIEGQTVSYCTTCRGFLSTNETFGLIVWQKRAKQGPAPAVPLPFAVDELKRRVKCPGCRKPMDTHPYFGGGNAVIDTCARCCLVWLDAGELTVLGQYKSRSGPVPLPADREPAPAAAEPAPVQIISLFGFPIQIG